MVRVKFEDKDHGWANWQKALGFLGGKQSKMEAGLLEGLSSPEAIFKGTVNEFHPEYPRPWFRTTMDKNADKYLRFLQVEYVREMEKGLPGGDARIKEKLGKMIAADLSDAIDTWSDPPNRPRTVEKKGFNDPLVETYELAVSPTYRILKPGESNG